MLSDVIYKWLDSALDYDISEHDFWNMTLAELERAIASKNRQKQLRLQEQANFDYILADLIGRSIGRLYSSSTRLPDITEAYPKLFDAEKIEQERADKKAEISAMRFRQFADSFNRRYKRGVKDE